MLLLIKALRIHRRGVAEHAHDELKRLAGQDLGRHPGPWLEWWEKSRRTPDST